MANENINVDGLVVMQDDIDTVLNILQKYENLDVPDGVTRSIEDMMYTSLTCLDDGISAISEMSLVLQQILVETD